MNCFASDIVWVRRRKMLDSASDIKFENALSAESLTIDVVRKNMVLKN